MDVGSFCMNLGGGNCCKCSFVSSCCVEVESDGVNKGSLVSVEVESDGVNKGSLVGE
jgi:hypothetical protein